jgi:catechol 2,3-dioxygenase-like lactoylglutathione lyase family enzyme
MRLFDHIDLRVRDLAEADRFYGKILPALGFPTRFQGEDYVSYGSLTDHPKPEVIALDEDRSHVPNLTRIAFWRETREDVESFAAILKEAGARNIEGPELCTEYSPGYYAVFFEDPCGNRLEVCCRCAV